MDCTGGSMRKIKTLYKAANEEYIKNRRTHKIVVDGAFFRDVAARRWPALLPIMRLQKEQYGKLVDRLNRANSPEAKRQAEEAINTHTRTFAEMKAEAKSGENSEVEDLIAAMDEHLKIEGKNVNHDDLEVICREIYTKYRDRCDDLELGKKVMTRLKGGRLLKTLKPVKALYDVDPADIKNSILDGNE